MTNDPLIGAVTGFYDAHPINEQQIIDRMRADGVDFGNVTEDTLQNYDQDHYGGVAANDALAALAAVDEGCHVLDACCGLGGPSRYLVHNYGCRVTGIDLTESRIEAARNLTALAGLDGRATFRRANALHLPFDDKSFDVVISQEAFCHVPDKDRLVAECVRVLKPGGRLAFTDILATDTITDAIRDRLQQEMTFLELASRKGYRRRLEREGCVVVEAQDISDEWRRILIDRLAMYRSLKEQTIERFGKTHFTKWDDAYRFFVGLYETGELAGGRFLSRRDDA